MPEKNGAGNVYSPKKTCVVGGIVSTSVLALDQATKLLAERWHQQDSLPIDILGPYLRLVYTINPGAAWGMLADYSVILTAVSMLALVFLAWRFQKMSARMPARVAALAALIGGVAGNLVDRIFRGAVIDFIDIHLYIYNWPVFNIADTAICFGVIVFAISALWREQPKDEHEVH